MYDGKVVFQVELDTKTYDTQMEKTKKDLKILTAKYDELNKSKKNDYIKEQLLELGMEIEKTSNKYVDLKKKQDAVFQADYKKSLASVKNIGMMNNSMYGGGYSLQYKGLSGTMTKLKGDLPYVADRIKDVSANVRNAGNNSIKAGQQAETSGHLFDKGFSRGLKSVKKLAMGIIGIRSAYFLARRAASAYMSEDTELTEKMNQAWLNLGAFLEPFLTFVADAMLKLTGYLNEFIKALTGTDYLARANAKALQKQTQAQAGLNKEMDKYQQYDFDVIRTQSAVGTGGVSGTGESGLGTLGDVELNEGLVKGIRNLASSIKDLIDLITGKTVEEAFDEFNEAEEIALDTQLALEDAVKRTTDLLIKNPDNKTPEQMEKATKHYQEINSTLVDTYSRQKEGVEEIEEALRKMSYGNEGELGAGLGRFFGDLTALVSGKGWNYSEKETKSALLQAEDAYDSVARTMQTAIYGTIELSKQNKLSKDGYKTLSKFVQKYGNDLEYISDVTEDYKFDVNDVYSVLRDYADVYPDIFAEMLGFNNLSDEQQRELTETTKKLLSSEGTIIDYTNAWKKVPSLVKTEAKAKTEKAEELVNNFTKTIFGVPTETKTKSLFDDKDATTMITKYEELLKKLGVPVTTTVKVDTSDADWKLNNLKSKLENIPGVGSMVSKLFSVLGVRGFASGGYISQPTFAMVGEGKYNEYVIPDGEDYISRLANEIGKYGSGSNTTNVYLDGRLIQRQVDDTRNRVNFAKNR